MHPKRRIYFVTLAVVYKEREGTTESRRSEGDWSCIATTKHEAIEQALSAKNRWEQGHAGPYKVLVGKLTEVAQVPVKYELVKL
jgi:hypothetical protein